MYTENVSIFFGLFVVSFGITFRFFFIRNKLFIKHFSHLSFNIWSFKTLFFDEKNLRILIQRYWNTRSYLSKQRKRMKKLSSFVHFDSISFMSDKQKFFFIKELKYKKKMFICWITLCGICFYEINSPYFIIISG